MNLPLDSLRVGARRILGRDLGDDEAGLICKYLEILRKWQRVHRLAGSDDPEWLVTHLILDSLLFLQVLPAGVTRQGGRLLDFGSGAGVPGVPLAIVLPQVRVTLLESRQRRASFLSEVVRSLPLANGLVVAERAEVIEESLAGTFDAVVMRCAGSRVEVVPVARQLVAPGGSIIVSGPPKASSSTEGEWVEVEGAEPGTRRRFLRITV